MSSTACYSVIARAALSLLPRPIRPLTQVSETLSCEQLDTKGNSTDSIVVYESKLGLICPYGSNSAARSMHCVKPDNVTVAARPPVKRERPVRRNIRMLRPWKID